MVYLVSSAILEFLLNFFFFSLKEFVRNEADLIVTWVNHKINEKSKKQVSEQFVYIICHQMLQGDRKQGKAQKKTHNKFQNSGHQWVGRRDPDFVWEEREKGPKPYL